MAEQDNKPTLDFTDPQFIEAVNKIIGGHVTKRFESFEGRLDGKFDQLMAKLPGSQAVEKQPDNEERLSLKSLQKDLEKVRAERDAERQANRDKTLRSTIAEKLTKAGFTPAQQKPIISMMVNEKLATLSDEGEGQFVGEYKGEFVTLDEGIDGWVKKEGKDFLPDPKGANARTLRSKTQSTVPVADESEQQEVVMNLLANHFGRTSNQ